MSGLVAVLEADGAVKDEMLRCAVLAVHAEVADAHELIRRCGVCSAALALGIVAAGILHERGLDLAAVQDGQRIGIQAVKEVLVRAVGLRVGEQIVVKPYLGIDAGGGIDPVDRCALDLPAVSGVAAAGEGIVLGVDLDDIAEIGRASCRERVLAMV